MTTASYLSGKIGNMFVLQLLQSPQGVKKGGVLLCWSAPPPYTTLTIMLINVKLYRIFYFNNLNFFNYCKTIQQTR